MMCWGWIDSSRKREALSISCPGPDIAPLGGARQGLDKNRENNPMQSRDEPDSQHPCCAASGARKNKGSVVMAPPNLIPL
jgi:hypothetical protein